MVQIHKYIALSAYKLPTYINILFHSRPFYYILFPNHDPVHLGRTRWCRCFGPLKGLTLQPNLFLKMSRAFIITKRYYRNYSCRFRFVVMTHFLHHQRHPSSPNPVNFRNFSSISRQYPVLPPHFPSIPTISHHFRQYPVNIPSFPIISNQCPVNKFSVFPRLTGNDRRKPRSGGK